MGDFFNAYKLVYLRVLGYFLVPSATLFLTQTETMSDGEWAGMGHFLRWRLYVQCFMAGFVALMAFIDSSMQKAREKHEVLKEETAFAEKHPDVTPPPAKSTTLAS